MARIDPLLKMIVAQGGNEMVLRANEQPQLFHSGSPLRLFLPPMGAGVLAGMLEPLLDPARRAAWEAGDGFEIDHTHASYGAFRIKVTRPGKQVAIRIERAAEPERVVEVAPVATPRAPAVPTAGAAIGAAPSAARILPPKLIALVGRAVEQRASDIHLSDDEAPVLRIDGRLVAVDETLPVTPLAPALLTPAEQAQLTAQSAVDLSFSVAGQARLRGHVYRHVGGLAAALRILARRAPGLDELGLPVDLTPLALGGPGLVIVSGPTGSGKSTTLAALAQHALDRLGGLLVTLEDPIEYVFQAGPGALVRQRGIGEHAPGFAQGLRAALREDPDVLLVGEMRDPESILLALTAAETGHLVLTTLHSRDTASAIARMLDAVPAERQAQVRGQIAAALKGIVAQRLAPKAIGSGRVPVLEVLRPTTGVRALIRDGKLDGIASALQSGGGDGMVPLAKSAAERVRAGLVRREDAEALLDRPETLRNFL